jgi:acetoin utilization deacetylase AcuC-like enzyme
MSHFAVYLHPETCLTSKPIERIRFIGHSLPHFARVREELARQLTDYPQLPLRQTDFAEFQRIHKPDYLAALQRMAADEPVSERPRLSAECTGFEYCLPGYQYGLGGMLEAIDRMRAGVLDRAYCFSLGGHHAYADWGHGYCLLNPQAVAVRYAQERGFARVLVLDWDIHHGDGTQSIFANDASVYCLSIHSLADLYMATQRVMKDGTTTAAEAVGHCNIPLLSEIYPDEMAGELRFSGMWYRAKESLAAFQAALDNLPWTTDLICIFSGYDSHRDECGAGITNWTNDDFRWLTQCVLDLARRSNCPVLSVHGGGYQLPVTVSAAVEHVRVLASYDE